MAISGAERQRRYRLHKQGDHSTCDPMRCDGESVTTVTGDVTREAPRVPLGRRGAKLWRDMAGPDMAPGRRELLEEACRLADRLDRLDAMLRGDELTWATLRARDDDGSIVEVVIDRALSEARQQQAVFKSILAELSPQPARRAPAAPASVATPMPAAPTGGVASVPRGVADLTARIAERRAPPAG